MKRTRRWLRLRLALFLAGAAFVGFVTYRQARQQRIERAFVVVSVPNRPNKVLPKRRELLLASYHHPCSLKPFESPGEEITTVRDAAFYAAGKRVMFIRPPETIELWEVETGRHLKTLQQYDTDSWVWCAAITADGKRAFIGSIKGSLNGGLTVYDVPEKRILERWGMQGTSPLSETSSVTHSLAISPDGKSLLRGTSANVELRNMAIGRLIRVLRLEPKEPYSEFNAVAFSPNGKYALSAYGNEIVLSDVPSGKIIRHFVHNAQSAADTVTRVAFSPDGQLLLTVGSVANLWDRGTGTLLRSFGEAKENMYQAAFTPDGKQIVSGGDSIHVWDVQTGQEVRRFPKAKERFGIRRVYISPNGKYVLGIGSYVGLWRIATGELVRTFKRPKSKKQ